MIRRSHRHAVPVWQSYFRENLGDRGWWEPDTLATRFRCRILKLEFNYTTSVRPARTSRCFGGRADGTKILAFDEPASGSCINSDLL